MSDLLVAVNHKQTCSWSVRLQRGNSADRQWKSTSDTVDTLSEELPGR